MTPEGGVADASAAPNQHEEHARQRRRVGAQVGLAAAKERSMAALGKKLGIPIGSITQRHLEAFAQAPGLAADSRGTSLFGSQASGAADDSESGRECMHFPDPEPLVFNKKGFLDMRYRTSHEALFAQQVFQAGGQLRHPDGQKWVQREDGSWGLVAPRLGAGGGGANDDGRSKDSSYTLSPASGVAPWQEGSHKLPRTGGTP